LGGHRKAVGPETVVAKTAPLSTSPIPAAVDPTGAPAYRSSPRHTSEMIIDGVALTG